MGFWKTFFGGEEISVEEEKKNASQRNFDLLKYDGVKAMRIGQNDYAVKCFREALKIQEDLEVHDYLSRALIRLGLMDEALDELKIIISNHPDNIGAYVQAAHVAYMMEDYTHMAALCEEGEAVDANNAMLQLMYARAELGQDRMVQAIARLTKTVVLDEELADARLLRGQTLLRMGDLDGAQADTDWLLAHVQDSEDVLLLQARILLAKGDVDGALEAYGRVVDVNPFQLDAYRERGKLRYVKGDKQGAEDDMQKVLELNPSEMADVSGDYSAEGIEQKTRRAYSNLNPFGI